MRVFVTGASGFIGKSIVDQLLCEGHEVLALVREGELYARPKLDLIQGRLERPSIDWFGGKKVDVVIHCAWIATPGEYLHSSANEDFVKWSENLLPVAKAAGVKKFIGVGTCLECPPSKVVLPEHWSYPGFVAETAYASCKVEWMKILRRWVATNEVDLVWARIFYPYGPGEHVDRFPSHLVCELMGSRPVVLRTPQSVKDYIYISDVGRAFGYLVNSAKEGVYHVGSGKGVEIRKLAGKIASILGVPDDLVQIPELKEQLDDPYPYHVGETKRLNSLGWSPQCNMERGLKSLIRNIKKHANHN